MLKQVEKYEEVPTEPHYAIFEFDTYWSDSGYPEDGGSSYPMVRYYYTNDKREWEEEISRRQKSTGYFRKSFSAAFITPASIKTTVHVEVNVSL